MDISVVIPAYNEEEVISGTIDEVKIFLQQNFSDFEILVVDDKSTDSTLNILKQREDIRLVRNLRNHGKGYSVAKGIKKAKGDWMIFMDADNSTRISEIKNFLEYKDKYAVIIGSRALKESDVQVSQSFLKVFLGKAGNLLSRILINPKIKDTQCGFKVFARHTQFIFDKLTIEGFAFDFELMFLAKKFDFDIKEVPVVWHNNADSAVRWHHYPHTLTLLFKIRLNNLLGKYN
ncbi:glycosyltransferase family 2 protein [Candidatus Parcubacteria bacterium]|jgi:dolichyl-phosphate beta-glucosyltransferase|nr:glycosyltransferase family 2 protein [Candidatus Parcubacteria bacterium]MBT7228700.1 glycosyltransferase family 2 protein [Candidatus Parcubacteria bacterium]